jgi:uncharacterized protein (DUF983 family)
MKARPKEYRDVTAAFTCPVCAARLSWRRFLPIKDNRYHCGTCGSELEMSMSCLGTLVFLGVVIGVGLAIPVSNSSTTWVALVGMYLVLPLIQRAELLLPVLPL